MRHKHADLIIAWANGAEIEYQGPTPAEWNSLCKSGWYPIKNPNWLAEINYRIKPELKTPGQVYFEAVWSDGWEDLSDRSVYENGALTVIEAYKKGELKLPQE